MGKLRVLDLFSGLGGFSLGLERTGGFETVAFCEIEEFPRKVLRKHWPGVPIYEDVRKLKGSDVGAVDVICGGYPCQPFSTAGKRRGKEDDRHLWPEFGRLVAELRPAWVIGENVAGHISMGLDDVLSDLEGQGYACRAFVIPACAVDAPHRRDRVWVIAAKDIPDANGKRPHRATKYEFGGCEPNDRKERVSGSVREVLAGQENSGKWGSKSVADATQLQRDGGGEHWEPNERQVPQPRKRSGSEPLADADGKRGRCGNACGVNAENAWQSPGCAGNDRSRVGAWLPEPPVGRVANGVPNRAHRLKALGNAVVPQIPEMIGHAILQAEGAA